MHGLEFLDGNGLRDAVGAFGYLDWYKIASPIGAGAFALLGLLANFKSEKTGKITVAGFIATLGITLSVCLGVTASAIERQNDLKTERAQAAAFYEVDRTITLIQDPELRLGVNLSKSDLPLLTTEKMQTLSPNVFSIPTNLHYPELPVIMVDFYPPGHAIDNAQDNGWQYSIDSVSGMLWDKSGRGTAAASDAIQISGVELHGSKAAISSDHSLESWLDLQNYTVTVRCISGNTLCDRLDIQSISLEDGKRNGTGVYLSAEKDCGKPTRQSHMLFVVCRVPRNYFARTLSGKN